MKKAGIILLTGILALYATLSGCMIPRSKAEKSSIPEVRNEDIRQFAREASAFGDDTENGMYFSDWSYPRENGYEFLYYFDDNSKQAVKLCSKPNCTHSGPDCDACFQIISINSIQYYDNRIFFWASGYVPGSGNQFSLISVAADGSDRKDYGCANIGGMNSTPLENLIYDDNVYMICDLGPSGNFPNTYKVYRQPLGKEQEAELLYESSDTDKEHYLSHLHVIGKTLYFTDTEYTSESIYRQDLFAMDLDTREIHSIQAVENGQMSWVLSGDSIYYSVFDQNEGTYQPVQRLDPETGEVQEFFQQGGILSFDGQNFYIKEYTRDNRFGDICIVDTSGSLSATIRIEDIHREIQNPEITILPEHIYIMDNDFSPVEPFRHKSLIVKKYDLLNHTPDPWTIITETVNRQMSFGN